MALFEYFAQLWHFFQDAVEMFRKFWTDLIVPLFDSDGDLNSFPTGFIPFVFTSIFAAIAKKFVK